MPAGAALLVVRVVPDPQLDPVGQRLEHCVELLCLVVRHGGREEQRLAPVGPRHVPAVRDGRHRALEAHGEVQHLVRLVEHDDLRELERDLAAVDGIQEPARGGAYDVLVLLLDRSQLCGQRLAPVHRHGGVAAARVHEQVRHVLGGLDGELPRGREHQGDGRGLRVRAGEERPRHGGVRDQPRHNGDDKRQGLPTACLRLREQVDVAPSDQRDGIALDQERPVEVHPDQGLRYDRRDAAAGHPVFPAVEGSIRLGQPLHLDGQLLVVVCDFGLGLHLYVF
mmetsp:Transcript_19973/g.56172  ORF Transcript_19973/g.56172 Transcript_19973/m.56172 type:complete len:281 (-) Transcript_19973:629-1471(-)